MQRCDRLLYQPPPPWIHENLRVSTCNAYKNDFYKAIIDPGEIHLSEHFIKQGGHLLHGLFVPRQVSPIEILMQTLDQGSRCHFVADPEKNAQLFTPFMIPGRQRISLGRIDQPPPHRGIRLWRKEFVSAERFNSRATWNPWLHHKRMSSSGN